jgi:hypothetical protein
MVCVEFTCLLEKIYFDLDVLLQFVFNTLKCSFWDSLFDHIDAKSYGQINVLLAFVFCGQHSAFPALINHKSDVLDPLYQEYVT